MPLITQTFATKAVRVISGLIGLLVVAYFLFLIYRIYFFAPHGTNNLSSVLPMVLITMLLAGMTIEFARCEWRRSLGVRSNPWKLRAFTVILIVIPVLISPFSPTTLVFTLSAGVLVFTDLFLGRSYLSDASMTAK